MTIEDSTAAPSPASDPSATAAPAPADTPAPSSSPADTGSQAPAATPTPGDKTASPPDAPVDDRAALLAAVRKVVEVAPENPPQGEGTPTVPEPSNPATTPSTPPAADPLDADPTEAELAGLVPKTRQRIERLLTERNTARREIESLKPAVAKWTQMEGYLRRNDLAAEDVNLLLGIGAALRRGDFKAFREGVAPYIALADQALGNALPPDLEAKVETGEMSRDAARELSVARIANARLQGQARANTEAAAARAAQEAQARVSQEIGTAVTTWEADARGRDPDYALKAPVVLRISQAMLAQEGRPKTAAAAVDMAKRAYDEASRVFAAAKPAPVATPRQPVAARAVTGARPEPKTLMEAARLGLERSRAQ